MAIRAKLIAPIIVGTNMVVVRVQDIVGLGPYRPDFSHRWTDPMHDARNPTFMDEFPSIERFLQYRPPAESAYGCGFRTIEQALKWFSDGERRKLVGLGYRLVVMKVDDIIAESDRQLVFWRRLPLRKNATPITEWTELALHCGGK